MRERLLRASLGHWVDPAAAYVALCGDRTDSVWLDSGVGATTGHSYLGTGSRRLVAPLHPDSTRPSVLDALRIELAEDAMAPTGHPGFSLGWVGWLGYESRFDTMRERRTRTSRHPDAAFLFLDRALEFDHTTREVTLLALGLDWKQHEKWRTGVERALAAPAAPQPSPPMPATAAWRDSDERYLDEIAECQRAITAGDAYQVCLTTEASVVTSASPLDTYLALRASNPTHHGALVRIGGVALLSASPEQFLSVTPARIVESSPIKGTRPRGVTAAEDRALANDLLASDKERAENLMIVDLMRNDISRVSRLGSVAVTSLHALESYANVHQLVSTIRGELDDDFDPIDAVVACFPAGSMTGAPKRSATRILDGLERRPRGLYAGAFGYFGLDGRVDLAMVIRSIVMDASGATVGAGGGITALSIPREELAEVKLKAAPLLRALGVDA